jgi:hypothetical protein
MRNRTLHILLGVFLLISSLNTWNQVGNLQEVPWGCDLFGHLRIAQEFREARNENRVPEFKLLHPQIQILIDWFKNTSFPVFQWEELVAPHAHHYVDRSHSVVDQYPPGQAFSCLSFPREKELEP